ncbi:hypothetical protein OUZ56_021375 [Daphnia magna]|uniref:Uncharacterized protein n=1 Tax=Daphnia magna TaxID=35525 RepID=A0ABQ9ZH94_9CRUS|nr:hypothetical protein OUZ56_021375 [Daphnia magna]
MWDDQTKRDQESRYKALEIQHPCMLQSHSEVGSGDLPRIKSINTVKSFTIHHHIVPGEIFRDFNWKSPMRARHKKEFYASDRAIASMTSMNYWMAMSKSFTWRGGGTDSLVFKERTMISTVAWRKLWYFKLQDFRSEDYRCTTTDLVSPYDGDGVN